MLRAPEGLNSALDKIKIYENKTKNVLIRYPRRYTDKFNIYILVLI